MTLGKTHSTLKPCLFAAVFSFRRECGEQLLTACCHALQWLVSNDVTCDVTQVCAVALINEHNTRILCKCLPPYISMFS
jgi:hypothetical protein